MRDIGHTVRLRPKCSRNFSLETIAKTNEAAKSKHEAVSWPFGLNFKEPWSTVNAEILVQIDDALSITHFTIDNYEISYTVPCHVSQPLPSHLQLAMHI